MVTLYDVSNEYVSETGRYCCEDTSETNCQFCEITGIQRIRKYLHFLLQPIIIKTLCTEPLETFPCEELLERTHQKKLCFFRIPNLLIHSGIYVCDDASGTMKTFYLCPKAIIFRLLTNEDSKNETIPVHYMYRTGTFSR